MLFALAFLSVSRINFEKNFYSKITITSKNITYIAKNTKQIINQIRILL